MAPSRHSVWATVLVAGLLVAATHALAYRNLFAGTCIDDAYISFRYVTHLADGHGLVFNPGERVEGYSNFLWVLLLTPFARFLNDISGAASWLGLSLTLTAIFVAAHGLRSIMGVTSPWALSWMLLLVAGSGYVAAWSISGMETGLAALLLVAAWVRSSREEQRPTRFPWSAVLFALLALARPDGIVLCLVALLHRFLRRRDVPFWGFAVTLVVILAAYHAWRFSYFGMQWLPNSVEAKTGGGWPQLWRGLRYFTGNFLFPYLPLLSILVMLRWRPAPPGARLGVWLVLAYLAVFTAAGGDWSWGRFFGPVLPLACVLFVGMVGRTHAAPPSGFRRFAWVGVALIWTLFAADLTSRQRTWKQWSTYAAADQERVALGHWLRENLPEDTRLAAFAIGQLAYYSGFETHDMLGITDPYIASLDMPGMGHGVPGHEKYDIAYTLGVVRPDVIIGAELMPGMLSSGQFMSQYQTVNGFWSHHRVAMHKDFVQRALRNRPRP